MTCLVSMGRVGAEGGMGPHVALIISSLRVAEGTNEVGGESVSVNVVAISASATDYAAQSRG